MPFVSSPQQDFERDNGTEPQFRRDLCLPVRELFAEYGVAERFDINVAVDDVHRAARSGSLARLRPQKPAELEHRGVVDVRETSLSVKRPPSCRDLLSKLGKISGHREGARNSLRLGGRPEGLSRTIDESLIEVDILPPNRAPPEPPFRIGHTRSLSPSLGSSTSSLHDAHSRSMKFTPAQIFES